MKTREIKSGQTFIYTNPESARIQALSTPVVCMHDALQEGDRYVCLSAKVSSVVNPEHTKEFPHIILDGDLEIEVTDG